VQQVKVVISSTTAIAVAAEMIAVTWVNDGKKGMRIWVEVALDLEEEKDLLRGILIM
jgi:hypothetical protein